MITSGRYVLSLYYICIEFDAKQGFNECASILDEI